MKDIKRQNFIRIIFIINILLIVFVESAAAENCLKNLTYAAGQEKLCGYVNSEIDDFLKIQIVDENGKPLINAPIYFQLAKTPTNNSECKLIDTIVYSDTNGEASTRFVCGAKEGIYSITASSPMTPNTVYLEIEIKNQWWWIYIIAGLIGGMAMFIYGLSLMGSNLTKLGGSRLTEILKKLTANQWIGIIVGTVLTTILQSSSATTVMLVGLINAGVMNFQQSIGIIYGANIGATTTPQIVAFKLTDYAIFFIGIGFIIMSVSKNKRKKYFGEILLGFGLLFYGLKIMSDVMHPMRSYQPFIEYIKTLENPVAAVIIGALFTALIQSSGAAISVFLALSFQGILTLKAAIPLTLGANIGTCITAWLASVSGTSEGKRAAWAHIYFNVLTTVMFLFFLAPFQRLIEYFSNGIHAVSSIDISVYVPRQIANANTISKIISVIVFLPFTKYLAKLCMLTIPVKPEKTFKPKYLDEEALIIPATALMLAKKEILRMAYSAKKMMANAIVAIEKKDADLIAEIIDYDDKIDMLEESIKIYLTKIAQDSMSAQDAKQHLCYLYITEYIEHIADIINKEIMPLTNKLLDNNLILYALDMDKLKEYHNLSETMFTSLLKGIENDDLNIADEIIEKKQASIKTENEIKRSHYSYLMDNRKDALATTSIYLDIINCYRAINSNFASIAYTIKGEI